MTSGSASRTRSKSWCSRSALYRLSVFDTADLDLQEVSCIPSAPKKFQRGFKPSTSTEQRKESRVEVKVE